MRHAELGGAKRKEAIKGTKDALLQVLQPQQKKPRGEVPHWLLSDKLCEQQVIPMSAFFFQTRIFFFFSIRFSSVFFFPKEIKLCQACPLL